MNKILLIGFLVFFHFSDLFSQSIRKNYREMTETEKLNLVNAFYQLRTGPDLVNDLGNFHRDFFNLDDVGDGTQLDIHLNLPDEPERDIFLAWHRAQMFEMEQAMQDINPDISLAYVDWTLDSEVDSPVWDEDFMGQFNDDWDLNRNIGNFGTLPTPQDITDLLNFSSDYLVFSNEFEKGRVHTGGHNWTGGLMGGPSSPKDPIFYLHHSFVDKIWQEWEERFGNSAFIRTSMIRYDGTYVFDGETLPLINPNDITDSRVLGVFYANNGLALLDQYEVSNEHRDLELFYYQYTIEIENDFVVPTDKNCQVESVNEIVLKPGFHVERGGNFYALIDNQDPSKFPGKDLIARNQIAFDNQEGDFDNVYGNFDLADTNEAIFAYPNPFSEHILIGSLTLGQSYEVEILNMLGNVVFKKSFQNTDTPTVRIEKLQSLNSGIYLLLVKRKGKILYSSKFIKS